MRRNKHGRPLHRADLKVDSPVKATHGAIAVPLAFPPGLCVNEVVARFLGDKMGGSGSKGKPIVSPSACHSLEGNPISGSDSRQKSRRKGVGIPEGEVHTRRQVLADTVVLPHSPDLLPETGLALVVRVLANRINWGLAIDSPVSRTFTDRRRASKNVQGKSLPPQSYRARVTVTFAPRPDEECLVTGDHQSYASTF